MELLMAFQLIVYSLKEKVDTEGMYFRDIHRCEYFSEAIEHRSPNVAAWCIPVMVRQNTKFWD